MDGAQEAEVIKMLFVGTVGMIVLAVGLFWFFLTYRKKLLEKDLEVNRIRSEQQKQLLRNSIDAQERERKRFSEDLHDEVGAALSAIKLNLSLMERRASEEDTRLLATELNKHVNGVIADIRRISRDLLPPSIGRFGFSEAVIEIANRLSNSGDKRVKVWINDAKVRFMPKRELALFRVVQELINNSVKHSGVSEVEVKVRFGDQNVWVVVSDRGRGFDLQQAKETGFGLVNIESRIEVLDAKYKIRTQKNKGTTTIVVVQITKELYDA